MTAFQRLVRRLDGLSLPWSATVALGCAAVVALSLVAVWPLFRDGTILTGDNLHAIRIFQISRCWEDGQVPCRWVPDMGNRFGYPLFNYYPPLPYYVGDVLQRIGLSYARSVDALFLIGLLGAGISMFILGRRLWGGLGGIVSAVAYVYAPYLALDVYMRGALVELWALALLPALLWAVFELVATTQARYVPLVALLAGLLLLAHNLVALIAAPIVAAWAIVLLALHRESAPRATVLGSIAGTWGFGLAAFFALPVLLEGDLVQLENLTREGLHYAESFVSVADLFFERSDDYTALVGEGTRTPVQIGWVHWPLAGVGAVGAGLLWRSGRRVPAALAAIFAASFTIGVFMTASLSEPVWDAFGPLEYLQFPWRYMGLVALGAAGLAGVPLLLLRERPAVLRLTVALVIVGLLIGTNQTFFHAEFRRYLSDEQMLTGDTLAQFQRGVINDYLPASAIRVPEPRRERAVVSHGDAVVMFEDFGSDWVTFDIFVITPATIEVSAFDFPEWSVRVDGRPVPHAAGFPQGLVTLELPPGLHEVQLDLGNTQTRRIGNSLSFASWTALALAAPAWLLASRSRLGARLRDQMPD